MKKKTYFSVVFLFLITSITFGCAAKKIEKEDVPPGQLSLEEIMGTDTFIAVPSSTENVNAESTALPEIFSRLEKLETGQETLQNNFQSLESRVTTLESRLNAFEKNILGKIREAEKGERKNNKMYPSIAFTEEKNAVKGFGLGQSKLSPRMKEKINAIHVYVSQKLLETPGNLELTIEGWADNLGSDSYNKKLSLMRAQSTRDYFESLLSPEQKDRLQINVDGKGKCSQKGDEFRFVIFRIN